MTKDAARISYLINNEADLSYELGSADVAWAFEAGWDAALKHSEEVRALVDALNIVLDEDILGLGCQCVQHNVIKIPDCVYCQCRKALKEWRGE